MLEFKQECPFCGKNITFVSHLKRHVESVHGGKTFQYYFQDTVREGGWSILYRGFGSTTYRAFIVNGVILLVYNNIMRHFSDSRIKL